MATLIATADGNLTTAATWGVVDATSLLDSEANNTALTTSYVSSAVFAPGAITVDGIAVKITSRNATPAGTMSVQLFNSTAAAAVAGTEVTINVSDIVVATTAFNGWLLLKFAAPVLLLAATDYTVQAKTSSATQVNLYRNATANNWSRMLRTTTTAAPGAGDNFFVLGEWTAAATKTNRTVTMNETASTDYGGGSTTLASVGISNGGTLTWGTTAATNYILRLSGLLAVWAGGVHSMGTTATPVPRDSSAQLEFDCAGDGDFGMVVYGTFIGQGLSRSAGKDIYYALLNTDEAIGQTTLGLDTDTGWKSGDEVIIAATTRTPAQSEERVLSGDAAASSITVTVGLTNAHSGTAPTQAEVALLTRNVRLRSVSTTNVSYVLVKSTSTVDCDWMEFRYLGLASAGKTGIEIETTTGACSFKYCAVRNSERSAFTTTGSVNHITIDSCVIAAIGGGVSCITVQNTTTGTDLTITSTILINATSATNAINFLDNGWTFTNNRIVANCGSHVITFAETGAALSGTISGNVVHSSSSSGINFQATKGGTVTNTNVWRLSGNGIQLNGVVSDLTFETLDVFGCNDGLNVGGPGTTRITVRNGTFSGDSSFATLSGAALATDPCGVFRFENCTFGVASGIRVAHTATDIFIGQSNGASAEVILINCVLASATEISRTALVGRGVIRHERVEGVTNVHKSDYPALGLVEYETTVFRTAAPSEKMTPSGAIAGFRLQSSRKRIPVAIGKAITVGVYVRKSALYVGSAPRLIMAANPALGIDNDIVLDSLTVAADTWEQLTGTQTPVAEEDGVVECYVDCDGSAGIVYIDDWSATTS